MNVTVPRELEEFVSAKTASGEYPDASAVVAEALRGLQDSEQQEGFPAWTMPLPSGACPPELKAALLEAVGGPHHPMPADYFERLRQRLRTSRAK
jgi:putative addiction module CopG family antidote